MTSLRDRLDQVRAEHGRLDPATVVEAATPKGHPLHARFEWSNAVAGHKYRLVQAHELIRSVKVTYTPRDEDREREVRYYHAVRDDRGHDYRSVEDIVRDPITTELLKREMTRDWKQLRARYSEFAEFVEMVRGDLEETG